MRKEIDILRKARLKMLEKINELSLEQLNKVPEGFNNNIIWNMGRLIETLGTNFISFQLHLLL